MEITQELAHRLGLNEDEARSFGLRLKVYTQEGSSGVVEKALRDDKNVKEELDRQSARCDLVIQTQIHKSNGVDTPIPPSMLVLTRGPCTLPGGIMADATPQQGPTLAVLEAWS